MKGVVFVSLSFRQRDESVKTFLNMRTIVHGLVFNRCQSYLSYVRLIPYALSAASDVCTLLLKVRRVVYDNPLRPAVSCGLQLDATVCSR